MIKLLKIIPGIFLLISTISLANTEKSELPPLEDMIKCVENNTDCNGKLPVSIGKINIDPKLDRMRIKLGGNCGFQINYFIARVYGHNKFKMPDGQIVDYGPFDFVLTNDYRYTIYSINTGRDWDPCPAAGGWYPDDGSTRRENIDLAQRLVNGYN